MTTTSSPARAEAPPPHLDKREVALKLLKWVLFEVLFAILPLFFAWASAALKHKDTGWGQTLGRGELLLVAVAIIAVALGDLASHGLNDRLRAWKLGLFGIGILLVCVASWLYSQVATLPGEVSDVDIEAVVVISFIVAPTAMFLSLVCAVVAEVK
ncbi:hypothetical protein [Actinophytocola oryzae]|uniref:hypothetical protein n=1 Tax=Actinophytocola oryzae TaxID=502181 RepID=UPI0010628C58|nr:hypothetical protein [Actinophytocola oryzae]